MTSNYSSKVGNEVEAGEKAPIIDIVETSTNTNISQEDLSRHGLERSYTGYIQWKKNSKDHPRNWSFGRKFYDTSVIISLELYT